MPSASVARPADPLSAVRALKSVFARQGTIVASYRAYRGHKLGPYYRLIYRAAGRQCSVYLGKSEKILAQVRRLLEKLQKPLKSRQILQHAQKTAQADLKRHMAQFRIDLLRVGLQLRGYSVRGWRRFRALRSTSLVPNLQLGNPRSLVSKLQLSLVPNLQLGNPCSPGSQPVQIRGPGCQPAFLCTPHAPREGVCLPLGPNPKLLTRLLRLLSFQPPMRGPTLPNCPFDYPADQKTPPTPSGTSFSGINRFL
jgi:hypothetical protein